MAFKWGFIGSGKIIPRFMTGFTQVEEAIPAAIYARNREKGQALAQRYGFEQVFDDIDEFIAKSGIDVAYVALPHPQHLEFTVKCLQAKIPVLCEKPMGPNREYELKMIEAARANNTFLAEAFWTRMFPATLQVSQWIREGKIGRVLAANGIFANKAPDVPGDRLYEPEKAGGALLDIGVYLVCMADLAFGRPPVEIAALMKPGKNGVDFTSGIVLKYDDGGIANLLTSFEFDHDLFNIYGTAGTIEFFPNFFRPRHVRLTTKDGIVDYTCPDSIFTAEGFQYEVMHIHDCLKQGLKESPIISLQQSLDIITVCDTVRAQWGLRYPFEK